MCKSSTSSVPWDGEGESRCRCGHQPSQSCPQRDPEAMGALQGSPRGFSASQGTETIAECGTAAGEDRTRSSCRRVFPRAGAGSEPAGCPGGGPAPGGCTERPWQDPARLPRSRVPRAAHTARRPGAAALSELQRFATSSAPPASSKAPAAPSRARPWPAGGGAGCPGELRGERSPHSAWGSRSAPCPLRASGPGQESAVRVPHLPWVLWVPSL